MQAPTGFGSRSVLCAEYRSMRQYSYWLLDEAALAAERTHARGWRNLALPRPTGFGRPILGPDRQLWVAMES